HGGGYLGSYSARSDVVCVNFSDRCPGPPLKKKPTEYLRHLYYDSIIFTPEATRHLTAGVGARLLVLGTGYPYPWNPKAVDHLLATPGVGAAELRAILGET